MDEQVLFESDIPKRVESAAEVFQETDELFYSEDIEVATEVGFPDSEPSAADLASQIGENVLFMSDQASENIAMAGDSEQESIPDPVYIPVLDDATMSTIERIESNTASIQSYVSKIESYLSSIEEGIPEIDNKVAHIESDVRMIGRNNNISYKIMVGCIVALLGAIIVTALFSKLR